MLTCTSPAERDSEKVEDFSGLSRSGHDSCVEELIPRVGQPREAPVDAVCVSRRVRLLLGGQQLPLPYRVHGGVGVLPELRECRDVVEVDGDLHGPGDLGHCSEQPPVRAHLRRSCRVEDGRGLLRAFYSIGVVPI